MSSAIDRGHAGQIIKDYNPDEPRNNIGEWTNGGGDVPPPSDPNLQRLGEEGAEELHELYQRAAAAKPGFDRELGRIAEETNSELKAPPLKGTARAVDKIISDYKGDVDRIKDIVRATIVTATPEDALKVAEDVKQRLDVLAEGQRNLLDPTAPTPPDGYRDIKYNVRLSTGVIAEVQINVRDLVEAKSEVHSLYEQRSYIERTMGDMPTPEQEANINSLNGQMRQVYAAAFMRAYTQASVRHFATSTRKRISVMGVPFRCADAASNLRGGSVSQALHQNGAPGCLPRETGIPSTSKKYTIRVNLSPTSRARKYSDDEPRDSHGRWTDAGGGHNTIPFMSPHAPRSAKPFGVHFELVPHIDHTWGIPLPSVHGEWVTDDPRGYRHADVERHNIEVEREREAEAGVEFPFEPNLAKDYNPDEPRDERGRWTAGGSDRSTWPDHIQALRIPPAWSDVHYSKDPDAKLLATGVDKAGRKQYVYNKEFSKSQAEAKFQRIQELNSKFDEVVAQNTRDRESTDVKTQENALVAGLVMTTGIRPGSEEETGAKVKAYGATTLEGRHVITDDSGTHLVFTGKKGVSLDIPVGDRELAAQLRARADAVGPNGQLFPDVTDNSLLDYMHTLDGGNFRTKDFRTVLGTRTAMEAVRNIGVPRNESEYKQAVGSVAKIVSEKLGNTPSVALQSYISPAVFAPWRAVVQ